MSDRLREWWRLWWDETLIIIGVSTAICLFIYGCWYLFQITPYPLTEGIVVGFDYTAQYEETHDGGTTCVSYDKDNNCTWRVQNPDIHHTHCIGGCYELQVDGCSQNRRGETKCRKEWKSVSRHVYENCGARQLWVKGENECHLR